MAQDKPVRGRVIGADRPNAIVMRRRPGTRTRRAHFAALGVIASHAPPAALLAALHELRPQCTVRLKRLKTDNVRLGPHYLVQVRLEETEREQPQSIDLWLRIKSALMAAFPANKPDAVTPLDT